MRLTSSCNYSAARAQAVYNQSRNSETLMGYFDPAGVIVKTLSRGGIYKLRTVSIHLVSPVPKAHFSSIPFPGTIAIHASPRKSVSTTSFPTHPIFPIPPQSSRQFHAPEVSQTRSYAHSGTQQAIDNGTEMHVAPQPLFAGGRRRQRGCCIPMH